MTTLQVLPVTVAPASRCREVSHPARRAARQVVRATPPTPLRLTRRGRAVLRIIGALFFALLVAAVVLLVNRPAAAGTEVRPVPVLYHVVLPGETLLEIAATVDPQADARDTAVRIARLNALDGWGLRAGQRLALPVEG